MLHIPAIEQNLGMGCYPSPSLREVKRKPVAMTETRALRLAGLLDGSTVLDSKHLVLRQFLSA